MFMLDEVPVMTRGRGVTLQRYHGGGTADIKTFTLADGLSYRFGNGARIENDLRSWLGKRGHTGRLPPTGFAKSNKFGL